MAGNTRMARNETRPGRAGRRRARHGPGWQTGVRGLRRRRRAGRNKHVMALTVNLAGSGGVAHGSQ